MDYRQSFQISAAGMSLEKMRVDVIALNLANANTAQRPDGVGFRAQRVVAGPMQARFASVYSEQLQQSSGFGARIVEVPVESKLVHEPGNPMANADGFVAYPRVDVIGEMVGLVKATRAYEANLAALAATRTMALKALDLGGTQ